MIRCADRYSEWKFRKEDRTLRFILQEKAKTNPNREFIRFKDGPWVSYKEVNDVVDEVANGLVSLGIEKGSKVGIMLYNCLEFIYAWFGLAKLGAIEVPINIFYKGDWLARVINNSDLEAIIIHQDFLDRLALIEAQLKRNLYIIVFPNNVMKSVKLKKGTKSGYDSLLNRKQSNYTADVNYYDPVAIMYTSGTTGLSKGAICSHSLYYAWAEVTARVVRTTSDDIFYLWSPLFHQGAQGMQVCMALIHEAKIVMTDRLSISTFWDELRKYNITVFFAFGQVIPLLMAQPESKMDKEHKVRLVYGFPAPAEFHVAFEERFGVKLTHAYGLTEGSLPISTLYDDHKVGTVGKVFDDIYEVRIVDPNDEEVPVNVLGEIVLRAKEPWMMFDFYYNMPEETCKSFRNLWFHTGDQGYRDDSGYYYFTGRIKDAIRRRGENISAFEIEATINKYEKVLESAAIAVPSAVGEDEVKVVIVAKPGEVLAPIELVQYCEPRMPYFAIPRYIEIRDELPKTPTEKVQKYILREEGITRHTWDREKAGIKLKR